MSLEALPESAHETGRPAAWLSGQPPSVSHDEPHCWMEFETEALPHLDIVFRYAMWLVRDRAMAEDLVQETYTQALQSFHRYTAGTNCRAWLLRILYCRDRKRHRDADRFQSLDALADRLGDILPYELSTPQGLTDEEVLQALGHLPLSFQEVVVLSDVEDFSYKEIAATLGVPLGTVMSRLHSARKALRIELSVYERAQSVGRVTSTFK